MNLAACKYTLSQKTLWINLSNMKLLPVCNHSKVQCVIFGGI